MENTKEESKKDGDNFDDLYTVSKKNENQKIALFPEDEKKDTKDEQSGTVKLEELKTMTEKKVKSTVSKRRNSSLVRQLVSKSKNRFCFDGFDLDLTYITPKIIAMGKPSTSIEGIYRNSVEEVQQFFNTRHKNHYKVYNLCQENNYPDNVFYAQGYYPFQDHEAPPLELIYPFCQDAKKFLDESEENVVAIHCKAGKGRTGTFISCLLLYLHVFDTAAQCLSYYGMMRAEDGKGVTIPSQIRYVYYFEKIIKNNIKLPLEYKTICLMKIRMVTIPDISSVKSGCTPSFSVENNGKSFKYWEFNKKKESYDGSEAYADFQIGESGFNASGDVKITFYHIPLLGSKEKIFKLWFNTNFIPDDGVLVVKKDLIDKACKDKNCKKFKPNFKIEIHCIEY
jgi:phosphatidylinositol-3,4,5-trisphosphate 3-phosphatase/dual-specificity protein phosphatase PTEN